MTKRILVVLFTTLMLVGLVSLTALADAVDEAPVEYTILVRGKGGQGTVVPDKDTAAAGETVTLTVTPETGWYLSSVKAFLGNTSTEIAVKDNSFIMPAGDVNVDAAFLKYRQIKLTKSGEYDISISSSSDGSYGSSLDTTPYGEVYVKVEPANDAVVIDSVYFEEYESEPFIQLSGQQIWYGRVPLNAPETLTVKVDYSYLAPTFTVTNQDGDSFRRAMRSIPTTSSLSTISAVRVQALTASGS